jgi:hypothetical protein
MVGYKVGKWELHWTVGNIVMQVIAETMEDNSTPLRVHELRPPRLNQRLFCWKQKTFVGKIYNVFYVWFGLIVRLNVGQGEVIIEHELLTRRHEEMYIEICKVGWATVAGHYHTHWRRLLLHMVTWLGTAARELSYSVVVTSWIVRLKVGTVGVSSLKWELLECPA